ncbi:YecA family protein [Salsuginibacillus kocurii]|uniref:YecA family protein n=1 Tax=Salsuginibacillus kocurii TaxID=427078 RepID=UPI000373BC8E|nr:SEC-C domain-containing protein [Salsuginibacillus kocurii]
MAIGRNEPCPCGSGKKYKKCCANTDTPSIDQLVKKDIKEIVTRYLEHAEHKLKFDVEANQLKQQEWKKFSDIGVEDRDTQHSIFLTWYALILNREKWQDFLHSEQKNITRKRTKEAMKQLEHTKILIGSIDDLASDYIKLTNWTDNESVTLYQIDRLETEEDASSVLTIAAPYRDGWLSLPAPLIQPIPYETFESDLTEDFNQSGQPDRQAYADSHFFDMQLTMVLSYVEKEADQTHTEEQPQTEVANASDYAYQFDLDITMYNEALQHLAEFLDTDIDANEQHNLYYLIDIVADYLRDKQPNMRKPAACAAAVINNMKDLDTNQTLQLTQKELGERFSVSPNTISRLTKDMEETVYAYVQANPDRFPASPQQVGGAS